MKPTQFKVVVAFENYSVGQLIEPTGLWRGELLRMRYIEPYTAPVLVTKKQKEPFRRKFVPNVD